MRRRPSSLRLTPTASFVGSGKAVRNFHLDARSTIHEQVPVALVGGHFYVCDVHLDNLLGLKEAGRYHEELPAPRALPPPALTE